MVSGRTAELQLVVQTLQRIKFYSAERYHELKEDEQCHFNWTAELFIFLHIDLNVKVQSMKEPSERRICESC